MIRFWRRRPAVTPAERALSRRALAEARAREIAVAHVIDATADARNRNHFGERFHVALHATPEGHQ